MGESRIVELADAYCSGNITTIFKTGNVDFAFLFENTACPDSVGQSSLESQLAQQEQTLTGFDLPTVNDDCYSEFDATVTVRMRVGNSDETNQSTNELASILGNGVSLVLSGRRSNGATTNAATETSECLNSCTGATVSTTPATTPAPTPAPGVTTPAPTPAPTSNEMSIRISGLAQEATDFAEGTDLHAALKTALETVGGPNSGGSNYEIQTLQVISGDRRATLLVRFTSSGTPGASFETLITSTSATGFAQALVDAAAALGIAVNLATIEILGSDTTNVTGDD